MERDSVQDRPADVEMPAPVNWRRWLVIAGIVVVLAVAAAVVYGQYQHAQAVAAFNQGMTYAAQSDLNRAITSFDQAVNLQPDYADAYYQRGLAYQGKQAYDLAITNY